MAFQPPTGLLGTINNFENNAFRNKLALERFKRDEDLDSNAVNRINSGVRTQSIGDRILTQRNLADEAERVRKIKTGNVFASLQNLASDWKAKQHALGQTKINPDINPFNLQRESAQNLVQILLKNMGIGG